ncbi:MAG: arylesterase [Marinomonas sp.]
MTKGVWCIFVSLLVAACNAGGAEDAKDNAQTVAEAGDLAADQAAIPVMGEPVNVLAFGDSLFAGYGVDQAESYPATLENALRAKGINAKVANAGVSGDTTAAGLQRFAFTLDAQETEPDLVIVELGGNDLLRQLPVDQTRSNLDAMLAELQKRDIDALVMGMRAPPNLGPEFQAKFDGLYGELAKKHDADLVPFFLESIYQSPELFQSDRIHPTPEGIEQLVEATVENVVAALPDNPQP